MLINARQRPHAIMAAILCVRTGQMNSDTPYKLLGGSEGVRKLAQRFYEIMDKDQAAKGIRALHQDDLGPMTEKLASFLNGWLGGPRDYFDRPDAPCVMSAHHRFPIGASERDQWLRCMSLALEETGASQQVRAMVEPAFARLADAMRNR